MTNQTGNDQLALLKQFSLRQADTDRQVQQALQQAMSALLQAQQLIQRDRQYHDKLNERGDYESLNDYTPADLEKNQTVPSALLGIPPSLQ